MRNLITIIAVIGALTQPQSPGHLVAPQPRPQGPIVFQAVRDLDQSGGDVAPQLRGGRIANSVDWPVSLYTTFPTPKGSASCTAALIGPRVMLTAAHCVPVKGHVSFTYGANLYRAECTMHPRYAAAQDASADYALCRLNSDFAEPGVTFETVRTSNMDALINQGVILGGYGCTSDVVGAGAPDGSYRIGFTRIVETSNAASPTRQSMFYRPTEINNLFTADDPALANLCPGDSGGPAFMRTGGADQFSRRVIVGVNSRVFYRDATETTYGASLVSATGGTDFSAWARAWASTPPAVAACGISGALPNCRN